ncbi:hypothetical protein GCM10010439_41480 [Actinocorallia aurantiaca]|uniref:Uncharacterized protein n=1 Tax=Actinocorallia aurantiaca TaxID=46204 RepID=A0ABN3UBZ0_9ACTN
MIIGWAVIIGSVLAAWQSDNAVLWAFPPLAWAFYQLIVTPTTCGVRTNRGHPCKNGTWGRLSACKQPAHSKLKLDELLRLFGLRNGVQYLPPSPAQAQMQSPPPPEEASTTGNGNERLLLVLTVVATVAGVVQAVVSFK